jgi:hypothetical protein
MTRDEFKDKWNAFKTKVFNTTELPADEENSGRMCFVAGMTEMYKEMTEGLGRTPVTQIEQKLNDTIATLREEAALVVKEGFQLLGEGDGSAH